MMPKPLGQEPDSVPVHEQVRELMRKAHTDRMAAVGIVFSQKGYSKALSQTVPGMDAFNNVGTSKGSTHYLGLPFVVSTTLTQGDVLLDLVPGGSEAAHASRQANRDARHQAGVQVKVETLAGKPTIEVIGAKLTAAQMCDIIMGFVELPMAAGTHTPLMRALHTAVTTFGEFE